MKTRGLIRAAAAWALSAILFSNQAYAATFTVTKAADTADGSCDGDCSLREAILAANLTAAPDRIVLPIGTYTLSIAGMDENAGATGDLDVTQPILLVGAGPELTTLDAGGVDRALHFRPESAAAVSTIQGLTVTGGAPTDANGRAPGGGVLIERGRLTALDCDFRNNAGGRGGAIHVGLYALGATASLSLRDSLLASNRAGDVVTANGAGGGLYVDSFSEAEVAASELRDNTASDAYGAGGGVATGVNSVLRIFGSMVRDCAARFGAGAYLYASAPGALIRGSTFSNNIGGDTGGGLMVEGCALSLVASRLTGNRAYNGGGLYVGGGAASPVEIVDSELSGNFALVGGGGGVFTFTAQPVTLRGTTLSGNTSAAAGGGYYQRAGTGVLENVTVTGNSVTNPGGVGGGVALRSVEGNSLLLAHATIAGNVAAGATQIYTEDEALPPGRRITVRNSIVQGAAACGGNATPVSEGGNVDGGMTCEFILASDRQNADAKLLTLAANGGPTDTRALGSGSEAIDAGKADLCLEADQRGYAREAACDSGAYESAIPAGAFACGPGLDGVRTQLGYAIEEGILLPPATVGDVTACLNALVAG